MLKIKILRALRESGKNRKLTQCSTNTRKFIFFAEFLARIQLNPNTFILHLIKV